MEKFPVINVSVSQGSQKSSDARQTPTTRREKPPVLDRRTDVEIPRSAWSAWREAGKPRQLRRPLTANERAALERRRDEIAPWVGGFHARENDRVAIALADMFAAFPSMGSKSQGEAMAKVNAVREGLQGYPLWAIEAACHRIRTKGFTRADEDRYVTERHWPPADPEIIEAVREAAKLYRDSYDSAVALLAADVEEATQ